MGLFDYNRYLFNYGVLVQQAKEGNDNQKDAPTPPPELPDVDSLINECNFTNINDHALSNLPPAETPKQESVELSKFDKFFLSLVYDLNNEIKIHNMSTIVVLAHPYSPSQLSPLLTAT